MQENSRHIVAQTRRRGRGAVSNTGGRFEVQRREDVSDGWEIDPERPGFKTGRAPSSRDCTSYVVRNPVSLKRLVYVDGQRAVI